MDTRKPADGDGEIGPFNGRELFISLGGALLAVALSFAFVMLLSLPVNPVQ